MKKSINLIIVILISFSICSPLFSWTKYIKNKNEDQLDNTEKSIDRNQSWSFRIAQSFIQSHPGSVTHDEFMTKDSWNYEQGVMLESMKKMYELTKDEQYFNFVKENINQYVNEDGKIRTYPYNEFNIDYINSGRALLFLYEKTKEIKYKIAADTLRKQIENQPRTISGGFWHKQIYPYQMWLDGLYMAGPFYAEYSRMFSQPEYFDDIINQFTLVYEKYC